MTDRGFVIGTIILALAILAGLIIFGQRERSQPVSHQEARETCVQHTSLGMHIHPELTIVINGQTEKIPANIGVTESCMGAMHTHDDSGTLHLEYTAPYDFVLADFFAVWGKTFNRNQVLDHQVNEQNQVTMTVNGEANTEFENLVLKDEQKIVITYGPSQ